MHLKEPQRIAEFPCRIYMIQITVSLQGCTSTAQSPLGGIWVWLLFATKHICRVGIWLKDIGRGAQKIAIIAKIGKRRN
jgi:hypothetical protein